MRRRIAQNLLVAPLSAYLLVGTATGTSFLTIRGDAKSMLARAAAVKQSGVNLIVLLALSDSGHAAYEAKHAEALASLGCPVFACTPDQFPSMMASALTGKDLQSWAAEEDIALIRGT